MTEASTIPNEDWRGLREHPYPGPGTGGQPYLGPPTGATMTALGALAELSAHQHAANATRVLPVYDGPFTGEQEQLEDGDQPGVPGVPGEPERAAAVMAPGRGRHAAAPSTPAGAVLAKHGARFTAFSAVGALVLIAGIAVQALLIAARTGRYGSYAGQAVFSIEASFLLNWRFTWRDRQSPFWAACWRFNVQKLALTVPNLALYAFLAWLGLWWLAANLAVTAVFLAANYATGDLWSFTASRVARKDRGGVLPPAVPMPPRWQPSVSAVIPCKGNEATILATVESLLAQDYPHLIEVILVGDVADSTWQALGGVRDPRLRLLEQEKTPGRRDPNVKRDKGVRASRGEVVALADSDIVMGRGWLTRAVGLLGAQGGGLVGGGMRAIRPHLFWPRFVDNNVLAAKTSRIPRAYRVTAANFGHRHRKPPITANAVVTRAAYEACPLDVAWAYGYEDYEWMHRLADAGCPITMDPGLTGAHHHREKFAHLVKEYRRSAHGCAQFVRRHPGSALAGKRRAQALGLPVLAVAVLAAGIAAVSAGHGLAVLALAIGTIAVLSGREAVRSRSLEAAAYPAAALALGGVFAWTLTASLLVQDTERDAPVWEAGGRGADAPVAPGPRRRPVRLLACLGLIMALAAALRFWLLADKPNWQVDEVTYYALAKNLMANHQLSLPTPYGLSWEPFLWHPPLYFIILSRWFALVGAGIYQARILGVLAALLMLGLLSRLIFSVYGARACAAATLFLATDGWLLYIQRCSYIENLLMLAGVAALMAYWRAFRSGDTTWYVISGALIGFTAVFKHTGGYILLAVLIHWLLTRKSRGKHLILAGVALVVIGVYFGSMLHGWGAAYGSQTLTQVKRVTGLAQSEGTLTSPLTFVSLMTRQYAVFFPSLTAGVAGIGCVLRECWQSLRSRSVRFGSPLIASWVLSGVVVFGASDIKYPQYFELVLLPAYIYLCGVLVRAYDRGAFRVIPAAVILPVVAVVGIASFAARSINDGGNPFDQAAQWMARNAPASAVVSAESPVGYDIPQRYCKPYEQSPPTVQCEENTSYVISWITDLQTDNPRDYPGITALLARSRVVASFSNFQGTIYIRKVEK